MKLAVFISIAVFLSFCGGAGLIETDDTDEAIKLVEEANESLKRIRVLYRENNAKMKTLEKALASKDVATVKKTTDDLNLVILDGYALAETAQDKLQQALRLNINRDFADYLRLKDESLRLQIKAFDYRRDSAKLFKTKFGTEDENALKQAASKFKENEANFAKKMAEATKVSEEADKLYKSVNNRARS